MAHTMSMSWACAGRGHRGRCRLCADRRQGSRLLWRRPDQRVPGRCAERHAAQDLRPLTGPDQVPPPPGDARRDAGHRWWGALGCSAARDASTDAGRCARTTCRSLCAWQTLRRCAARLHLFRLPTCTGGDCAAVLCRHWAGSTQASWRTQPGTSPGCRSTARSSAGPGGVGPGGGGWVDDSRLSALA